MYCATLRHNVRVIYSTLVSSAGCVMHFIRGHISNPLHTSLILYPIHHPTAASAPAPPRVRTPPYHPSGPRCLVGLITDICRQPHSFRLYYRFENFAPILPSLRFSQPILCIHHICNASLPFCDCVKVWRGLQKLSTYHHFQKSLPLVTYRLRGSHWSTLRPEKQEEVESGGTSAWHGVSHQLRLFHTRIGRKPS